MKTRKILVWVGIVMLLTAFGLGTLALSYFFGMWIAQLSGSEVLGHSMGILMFVTLAVIMGVIFGVVRFLLKQKNSLK